MIPRPHRWFFFGRDVSVSVAVAALAMLVVSVLTTAVAPPAAAAQNAGALTLATSGGAGGPAGGGAAIPVTEGGSGLPLALVLPANAACTGDSASGGYRVQTFMVPGTTDPTTLRFSSSGPVKPGGAEGLWFPLFSTAGNPVVNFLTDIATSANGPGTVSGLPLVDFRVYGPGELPAGDYLVGVACTLGNQSSATQVDRFWAVRMTFVASADDPVGVTWTASAFEEQTTTSTTLGDNTGDTTTTTAPDFTTTTTTDPGATTSTVPGDGSTTTTLVGAGGGTGGAGGTGTGPGGSALPATGASSWMLAVWAFLFLVAGRMAWLFSRRTRVLDSSA